MKRRTLIQLASTGFLAGVAGVAFAADISVIEPSAANVRLDDGKAVVRFTVSSTAAPNDRCGYFVDYGDGAAGDSRVIEREGGRFNRTHERSFSSPGTYTVRASGRNVKTTSACNGSATTTVTVVAGGRGRRAAAPACPEGWKLNEASVNQRTGAFSCSPKPQAPLACADGLRYYERDGMIGCRERRRDRDRDR